MKLTFFKYLAAPIVFAALIAAAAWNRPSGNTYVVTDENGVRHEYDFAPPKPEQLVIARDTISAATSTVVNIPWILASPYQYQYYVRLRKIGVTPNVKVVLQEANNSGAAFWVPVDSFSCSGADSVKVNFLLRGSVTYGAKHRLRFTKTGTGAVERDMIFNIKPTTK